MTSGGKVKESELPGTLKRSPKKARLTFAKTHGILILNPPQPRPLPEGHKGNLIPPLRRGRWDFSRG
jgi:hypothetical protein